MPTYTDPASGKKIRSDTPLNEDELNEAFGHVTSTVNPTLPKKRSIVDDIQTFLENTPAAPLAHPKELLDSAKGLPSYVEGLTPEKQIERGEAPLPPEARAAVDTIKGLGSGLAERYHHFADQPDETNVNDVPGQILQTLAPLAMSNKAKGVVAAIPVLGDAMVAGDKLLSPGSKDTREGAAGLLGQLFTLGLMKSVGPSSERLARGPSEYLYQQYLGNTPLAEEAAPVAARTGTAAMTRKGFSGKVADLKDVARQNLEDVKSSFGPTETVSKAPALSALDDLAEKQVLKDPGELTGPTFKPDVIAKANETANILNQTTPPPALVQQMKGALKNMGWDLTDEEVAHLLRNRVSLSKAIQAKQQLQDIANRGGAYPPHLLPPDISASTQAAKTGASALRDTIHAYSPELASADQSMSDLIRLHDASESNRLRFTPGNPLYEKAFLRKFLTASPVITSGASLLSQIADALASGDIQKATALALVSRQQQGAQ